MIQKENGKVKNSLLSIKDYLLFFILIAGSVTASFILFTTFTDFRNSEGLSISAVLTFGNVMFIILICTAIYGVWRYFFIVKPVNRILEGTDKIRNGQFGETIPLIHKNANNYNEFDVIIDNLNIMSKELQGIETLRTDFISNVSHELKTPLASIQNYAALMQSEDLSEAERKEYSKTIMESAKHLTELITNILRLNKLENQTIRSLISVSRLFSASLALKMPGKKTRSILRPISMRMCILQQMRSFSPLYGTTCCPMR